jgi:hypothetical protein
MRCRTVFVLLACLCFALSVYASVKKDFALSSAPSQH